MLNSVLKFEQALIGTNSGIRLWVQLII